MNPETRLLYRNVIEWEQKKKLTLHGDSVLLGDSVIHNYRFCENYYFVSGDKMVNSKDSRYWGLLPEPFIVGRGMAGMEVRQPEYWKNEMETYL